MERDAFSALRAWQAKPDRKPLVLHGVRQVGKTWLLKEFGRRAYQNVAYVNFQANPRMRDLFALDLDIKRLLVGLRIEANCPIEPARTLLVFDEVQECPPALASLKYFAENASDLHLAAAGSLLGLAMHSGVSFPVGKVEFLDLKPMSFIEFLHALGEDALAQLVAQGDWPTIDAFRQRLTERLRVYLCVGGMPEPVKIFSDEEDIAKARAIQTDLLLSYEQDFSKYAEPTLVPRIRSVWNSLPAQLAREQRKFVYGLVREGARAREYETAIEWLCDAGLVRKLFRTSKPGLPLKAYKDLKAFKLYMADVGLLGAHAGLPASAVLDGDRLFEEFKGALTEQYAAQELSLSLPEGIAYWANDTSRTEVDFVLQTDRGVAPLEIKAGENLQSKSLRSYRERFSSPRCYRGSLSPYRREEWLTNIPLYALSRLRSEIEKDASHPQG